MKFKRYFPSSENRSGTGPVTIYEIANKRRDEWEIVEVIPAGANAMDIAGRRVRELQRKAWDKLRGRALTRFETNWYVTIDPDYVEHLCKTDKTPPNEVRITENVGIVHATDSWTLWSDHRITKSCSGIPTGFGSLSSAAIELINAVRDSDSGYVEGGAISLIEVDEIIEEKTVEFGPGGHYASETITELVIQWRDGSVSSLYAHSAGYFEGYQYDLYRSLDWLKERISPAPGPGGLSSFPAPEHQPVIS